MPFCSGSETMENDLLPQAAGLPDHHRNPWLQSSVPVLLLNSEFQPEAREEGAQCVLGVWCVVICHVMQF